MDVYLMYLHKLQVKLIQLNTMQVKLLQLVAIHVKKKLFDIVGYNHKKFWRYWINTTKFNKQDMTHPILLAMILNLNKSDVRLFNFIEFNITGSNNDKYDRIWSCIFGTIIYNV